VTRLRRALRAHPLAWLLALLLLQAQALGLWHAVAHAGHGDAATLQSVASASPFGHTADDEPACRLYDQVATAAALTSAAPPWLAETTPTASDLPRTSGAAGRTLRPYQARAPPRG